jgi:CelD/BcsL family acetyltransferase involved in cellulose biosynthesis
MKASVCRPSDLNASDLQLWHSFQSATNALAGPFLTPEFAGVMSERRSDMRLAVLEEGGRVVGFFPFERNALGIGRAFCYGLSDMQAVVHAPAYEWDGMELLEACGLAVWEFDHLIAEQVRRFAPQECAPRASPVVDLRDGWENWIARKKASRRIKRSKEQERKLVREHGPLQFAVDSRDPRHLEQLMQWKSAQYRRTGRFDRFARRWFADGMRRLFETRTENFSVELSVTFVRDRPASFYLSLRSNGILAGWFPAYDIDLAPYGLGTIHQRHLLMHAAGNGIKLFDCGAGEEGYKQTFRDFDIGLARGSLRRNAAIAVAHHLQRTPRKLATEFVLSRPPLRKAARKALLLIGSLRSRLHPG